MSKKADINKGLPWFRLWAEFAVDPKVQILSEVDQRRYIMLLCLRCHNGSTPLDESEIVFQLRISPAEWEATKAKLLQKKLIDSKGQPTAWGKRQAPSDHSKDRVKAHRERKKRYTEDYVTVTDRYGNGETAF